MKKKKLNKLGLNKTAISNFNNLNKIKGGASDSPTVCQVCPVGKITEGDCDFPTIGHDDGPWCISKVWDWCKGIE